MCPRSRVLAVLAGRQQRRVRHHRLRQQDLFPGRRGHQRLRALEERRDGRRHRNGERHPRRINRFQTGACVLHLHALAASAQPRPSLAPSLARSVFAPAVSSPRSCAALAPCAHPHPALTRSCACAHPHPALTPPLRSPRRPCAGKVCHLRQRALFQRLRRHQPWPLEGKPTRGNLYL